MKQVTFTSFFNFLNRLTPEEMAYLFLSEKEVSLLTDYDINYLNHSIFYYFNIWSPNVYVPLTTIISLARTLYYREYTDILNQKG